MTEVKRNFPSPASFAAVSYEHSPNIDTAEFKQRVRVNQESLASSLRPQYDFIICGSGPAGSAIASRLSENPEVKVLLLEAGGVEDIPEVQEAALWPLNLGSSRVWRYASEPLPFVNNRSIHLDMGKILGGGSSVNVGVWARGHEEDWNSYAIESGDSGWNYSAALDIYRRIESWQGLPDPVRRGSDGPIYVQPASQPNDFLEGLLESSRAMGVSTFPMQNGEMLEHRQGASIGEALVEQTKRRSIFRGYVYPAMDRPNLTVLTEATVERLILEGHKATGVEISYGGEKRLVSAGLEVILSTGALHTPKLLMQAGIGDEQQLRAFDIPLVQCLPGVGKNLQDHAAVACNFEYTHPVPLVGGGYDFTAHWASNSKLNAPDILACTAGFPLFTPELAAYGEPFESGHVIFAGLAQPKSHGRILVTGKNPSDPIRVDLNYLSHSEDMPILREAFARSQELHMSSPMRPFIKRAFGPVNARGNELDRFICDSVSTFWHYCGTAKMGNDAVSVVDSKLRVYGIASLRIADASVLPHIPRGNTQAPCVVIGERCAEMLKDAHRC